MAWFKHKSDAVTGDMFIQDLMRRFGLEGYGFYFATLELLARSGSGCKLRIGVSTYCKALGKRPKQLLEMLTFCAEYRGERKMIFAQIGDELEIEIPNFKKYGGTYIRSRSEGGPKYRAAIDENQP